MTDDALLREHVATATQGVDGGQRLGARALGQAGHRQRAREGLAALVAVHAAAGLTAGEYGVMRQVGTEMVLGKLADRDPLLLTDRTRGRRR